MFHKNYTYISFPPIGRAALHALITAVVLGVVEAFDLLFQMTMEPGKFQVAQMFWIAGFGGGFALLHSALLYFESVHTAEDQEPLITLDKIVQQFEKVLEQKVGTPSE